LRASKWTCPRCLSRINDLEDGLLQCSGCRRVSHNPDTKTVADVRNAYGAPTSVAKPVKVKVIKKIKREGQRILMKGANVRVQLKQAKGTKQDDGYVMECYDDGHVLVHLNDYGVSQIVPVNEFIKGRAGTTPVRKIN
jgi:hypothetical protein